MVLRPQEISNNPEVIRRLGIIAINTAIEVDIFGHVNSNILGKIMNGIGGSGDFTCNAYISIYTLSVRNQRRKNKHYCAYMFSYRSYRNDSMIFITEQGIADLRGKSPRQKSN